MPSHSPATPLNPPRYAVIDAVRGVAMVWMTVFHFGFDLAHFGLWSHNFRSDPFWTLQRTAIVSLFLFCAGFSQAVAVHQGQSWSRFWRRWGQIAACAALVSAGSYAMFPDSFIYFGVLHGMAVMLIVARLTAGWGHWLWFAGAVAIALPTVAHDLLSRGLADWAAWFNGRPLNWLGLVSRKPFTQDYVPVFPWLGVMWWGLACGQWMLMWRSRWLRTALKGLPSRLSVLGRWSLSYYMLHQPVLIGGLLVWIWFTNR